MPFSLPLSPPYVQDATLGCGLMEASLHGAGLLQTPTKGLITYTRLLILRLPLYLPTGDLWDRPHDRVFPPDLQNLGFVCSTISLGFSRNPYSLTTH